MTPYRKVENCKLTDEVKYMTADEETEYYISQATVELNENDEIVPDRIPVRYHGETIQIEKEKVTCNVKQFHLLKMKHH